MPVFPGELGRAFFSEFADPIVSASPVQTRWSVVHAVYPLILLSVLDPRGAPFLGVVVDATDWPHRPPSATPCTADFAKRLSAAEAAPFVRADDGERHIYTNARRPLRGAYFCVEGTREFHEDYADALDWESVRHLKQFSPVAIINNIVALLIEGGDPHS